MTDDSKPTPEQLRKQLLEEQKAIRELFLQPAGKILLKHWKKMRMLRLFDPDPQVLAYRTALHDLIETLISIAEGNDE
jgi:hypothetical protein